MDSPSPSAVAESPVGLAGIVGGSNVPSPYQTNHRHTDPLTTTTPDADMQSSRLDRAARRQGREAAAAARLTRSANYDIGGSSDHHHHRTTTHNEHSGDGGGGGTPPPTSPEAIALAPHNESYIGDTDGDVYDRVGLGLDGRMGRGGGGGNTPAPLSPGSLQAGPVTTNSSKLYDAAQDHYNANKNNTTPSLLTSTTPRGQYEEGDDYHHYNYSPTTDVQTPKQKLVGMLRGVPSISSQLSSAVNSPNREVPQPTHSVNPSSSAASHHLNQQQRHTSTTTSTIYKRQSSGVPPTVSSSLSRASASSATTYFERRDDLRQRSTINSGAVHKVSGGQQSVVVGDSNEGGDEGTMTLASSIRSARAEASGMQLGSNYQHHNNSNQDQSVSSTPMRRGGQGGNGDEEVSLSEQDAAKIFHLLQLKDSQIADLTQSLTAHQEQLVHLRENTTTTSHAQEELVRQCEKHRVLASKFEDLYTKEKSSNEELKAHVKHQLEEAVRRQKEYQNAMSDALEDKDGMKEDMEALRGEVDKLTSSETRLRKKLVQTSTERDGLQRELQNMCDDLKLLISNAVESTHSNEHIVSALNTQLKVAEAELKQIHPIVELHREEMERVHLLEERLRDEQKKNVHLEADIRAIQRRDQQRVADSEMSREIADTLQSQLDALEQRLRTAHDDLAAQFEERKQADDNAEFSEMKRQAAERQVQSQDEQLEEYVSTITALKIDLQQVTRDNAALIADYENSEESRDVLENRVRALQDEVTELTEVLDLRRQHTSALHEQSSAVELRVDLLEDALLQAKAKLSAAERAADELSLNCQKLEGKLQEEQEKRFAETVTQRQEFADVTSQQAALIRATSAENQTLSSELAQARCDLKALEDEHTTTMETLKTSKSSHATLTADYTKSRHHCGLLRTEASKKEEYIAVLETKMEELHRRVEQHKAAAEKANQEVERHRGLLKNQRDKANSIQESLSERDRDQGTLESERVKRTQLEARLKSSEVQISSKSESLKRLLQERSEQLATITRLETELAQVRESSEISKVREVSRLTAALHKSEKQVEDVCECLEAQQRRVKTLFGAQLRAAMGAIADELVTSLRYIRLRGKHNRAYIEQVARTSEETLKRYEGECLDATNLLRQEYTTLAHREQELRKGAKKLLAAHQQLHQENLDFKMEVSRELVGGAMTTSNNNLQQQSVNGLILPLTSRPKALAQRHVNMMQSGGGSQENSLVALGKCSKQALRGGGRSRSSNGVSSGNGAAPSLNVSSVKFTSHTPSLCPDQHQQTTTSSVRHHKQSTTTNRRYSTNTASSSLDTSDETDMLWEELQRKAITSTGGGAAAAASNLGGKGGGSTTTKLSKYLDDIANALGCAGGFDELVDTSVAHEQEEERRLGRISSLLDGSNINTTNGVVEDDTKQLSSKLAKLVKQGDEGAASSPPRHERTQVPSPTTGGCGRTQPHDGGKRSASADSTGLVSSSSSTSEDGDRHQTSHHMFVQTAPVTTKGSTTATTGNALMSTTLVLTAPTASEELLLENKEATRLKVIKVHIQELLLKEVRNHLFCTPSSSNNNNGGGSEDCGKQPTKAATPTPAELRVTNLFSAQKRSFTSLEDLLWAAFPPSSISSSSTTPSAATIPKHLSRLQLKDVFTYCVDTYCKL